MNLIVGDPRQRERPWLHYIRTQEINKAAEFLKMAPGKKLLEIGGGDGHVACELSKLGFDVTSVDLAPRFPQSYPVRVGDSTNLKFEDATFDVVFTCHVLQEIPWPPAFREMKRVLKDDGIAVHIVPTTQWSLVSNFWHFFLLPAFLWKSVERRFSPFSPRTERSGTAPGGPVPREAEPQTTGWTTKQRLSWVFLHPLGFYPSFFHEIVLFSRRAWTRLFECNGFTVVVQMRGPILASGRRVFPFRAIPLRRSLSRFFPSSRIFWVRAR